MTGLQLKPGTFVAPVAHQLTIVGANGSSPDHNKRALAMIASGEVPVNDLITVRLPLERVHDAIDTVAKGAAIKVTIEP
jgi:L-iditol 2-dehydrogenase